MMEEVFQVTPYPVRPLALYALSAEGEPDLDAAALSWVGPEQARRVRACSRRETARQRLFAALFVRRVIGGRLGVSNREIRIAADSHGKPFLPGVFDLHFNLSHSGARFVLAIGPDPVGVDIERVREVNLRVARAFHPREQAYLAAIPATARREAFFDLWTRKESYLKARGMGLRCRLDSFSVVDKSGRLVDRTAGMDDEGWNLASYLWDGAFRVALAFRSGPPVPSLQRLSWEAVLEWFGADPPSPR